MLKAIVNGKNTFEIESNKGEFKLNNEKYELDILPLSNDRLHILKNNKSYSVDLISFDSDKKIFEFTINGKTVSVEVKDRYDELLKQLGIDNLTTTKVADIKAPMPGLVIQLNILVGDQVKKGDTILVLEAMKMENSIKAQNDATIKSIKIAKGDKVEKNQVLIIFE